MLHCRHILSVEKVLGVPLKINHILRLIKRSVFNNQVCQLDVQLHKFLEFFQQILLWSPLKRTRAVLNQVHPHVNNMICLMNKNNKFLNVDMTRYECYFKLLVTNWDLKLSKKKRWKFHRQTMSLWVSPSERLLLNNFPSMGKYSLIGWKQTIIIQCEVSE